MPALKTAARNAFSIVRTNPAFSGATGQIDMIGGRGTKSGQKVDEASALRVGAIWIATTTLADETASLPIKIVKRDDIQRQPLRPQKLRALWGEPNPDQTRFACDAAETLSMALWGASYTMLNWTNAAELATRITIDPSGVSLERLDDGGLKLKSIGQGELFNRAGQKPEFEYCPWYTLPGKLTPVSPIRMASELAGLSLAYEETAARLQGRGMNPSAVVTADDAVKEEQAVQLSARLERLYGSASNAGKIAVLGGKGMKIERMTMSAVDAQMVEHYDRVFDHLMAMWKVPATVAGMVNKPSTWGSGVAEFARGLHLFAIRPIVNRRQASKERITAHVDPDLQVRYPFDALLSAAPTERTTIQSMRLQNGSTSVERVLAQEDEPPFRDDETVYSPLAMALKEDRRLAQIAQQAETYGALIRAGATPEAAAEVSGFDPSLLKHTGAPPVTLQPQESEGA